MAGLLNKLDRPGMISTLPTDGGLAGIWLDKYPAVIEHMLASDIKSFREGAIPSLVDYLRYHGRSKPMLACLADWIDPDAVNSRWKLEFKRRKRGSRTSSDRKLIKQAGLVYKVEERTAQLKATGTRSPRKQAISQIVKEERVGVKTIEAAITSFKKTLRK